MSGEAGPIHMGDELEHAGYDPPFRPVRPARWRSGSGAAGPVHLGDELEHVGLDMPDAIQESTWTGWEPTMQQSAWTGADPSPAAPSAAPARAERDHGVRAFDPELAAHKYRVLARGRFQLCKTTSGRFYALVSVETELGHLCIAIHLEAHAARALAIAQSEHLTHQTRAEAAGFDLGDIGKAIGGAVSDVAHGVEHAVSSATKAVEHVAAPVVNAVHDVANKIGHSIEAAAAAVPHEVDKAVKDAAKLLAKAHLGDLNASKFVKDVIHGAEQGIHAAQNAAKALTEGAKFLAQHINLPKVLAGAIPIPAVRNIAQQAIGAIDPIGKFTDAIDALSHGDMNKLKTMGLQELSETQSVVSLVPGIGSGISGALGTAEALLNGGAPLEIALRTAYGAIPIPPGVRAITDQVLDAVLALIQGKDLTDAALAVARDRIPSGIPRDIFDTLVNIVAKHQPITKAAEDLAGHYVATYTRGLLPAVTDGLSRLVPPEAAHLLDRLPPMTQKFAGFKPEFKEVARVADMLRGAAPPLLPRLPPGRPPAIPGMRALPPARVRPAPPPAPRRIIPLRGLAR